MNLLSRISAIPKRLEREPKDPTEKAAIQSDIALARKFEAAREAEGPEVAALAAIGVAAEFEKTAKDAELRAKLAKSAAKSSRKIANRYKKEAARVAASASAAETDAAAKEALATRMIQSAALDEVEEIISEEQRKP